MLLTYLNSMLDAYLPYCNSPVVFLRNIGNDAGSQSMRVRMRYPPSLCPCRGFRIFPCKGEPWGSK